MPLTELVVRNARPKDRDYKLADAGGLHLLVRVNGTRLWRMKYRFAGREKLLSFGAYPVVSLAAARQQRYEAKEILAAGADPAVKRKLAKFTGQNSFEQMAREWHGNRKDTLDPAHEQRVLARLERDVFPIIGSRPITQIEPPEILMVVRKIEARGALDISRRARQMIGQVFRYAIACGAATTDPSAGLTGALRPKPRVEHMAKLPIAAMGAFLAELEQYDGDPLTRLALLFTIQTWARTGETRFARWSEFTEKGLWRIPADRMKMGREHVVPLSRQTQALVAVVRLLAGKSEFVFPGTRGAISENTMLFAMYRLGYHSRATVHGFRGVASTWANESGNYAPDVIEMALAHGDRDEVRGAYNAAQYLDRRRAMLQDWCDMLEMECAVARMLG